MNEGGISANATPRKAKKKEGKMFCLKVVLIVLELAEGVTSTQVVSDSLLSVNGCKFLRTR